MKPVLEGLLFISGDEGISLTDIQDILEIEEKDALELLKELKEEYSSEERGVSLKKLGGVYKLTTKKEHRKYYEKLAEASLMKSLSQSALETLAIIAYNEPVTRLQVDEFRGVNSSQMIRNLAARDFIKEVGRSESLGRPILYGITDNFLDYFGINSKDELPRIEDIKREDEEIDLYDSRYSEEIEEL